MNKPHVSFLCLLWFYSRFVLTLLSRSSLWQPFRLAGRKCCTPPLSFPWALVMWTGRARGPGSRPSSDRRAQGTSRGHCRWKMLQSGPMISNTRYETFQTHRYRMYRLNRERTPHTAEYSAGNEVSTDTPYFDACSRVMVALRFRLEQTSWCRHFVPRPRPNRTLRGWRSTYRHRTCVRSSTVVMLCYKPLESYNRKIGLTCVT